MNDMPADNRLLALLPTREAQELVTRCERVDLVPGQVLYEPGSRIGYVFFPAASFIALTLPTDGKAGLVVGLIGNEGMLGAPLLMGIGTTALGALVCGGGPAWRMRATIFVREFNERPILRRVLLRYLCVQMIQLTQLAACTRFHLVEQRLARLLLMTQDREHAPQFHATHESLSRMLGVRRVGVTRAAKVLQTRRLMRYHRGEIAILNRPGMKSASCSCYQTDIDTYDRLFPSAG